MQPSSKILLAVPWSGEDFVGNDPRAAIYQPDKVSFIRVFTMGAEPTKWGLAVQYLPAVLQMVVGLRSDAGTTSLQLPYLHVHTNCIHIRAMWIKMILYPWWRKLMQTKAFKNGNSQAVRIPAEIAYESTDIELEIVRIGDRIIIEPVMQSPGMIIRQMTALPDFMAAGRVDDEQEERGPL